MYENVPAPYCAAAAALKLVDEEFFFVMLATSGSRPFMGRCQSLQQEFEKELSELADIVPEHKLAEMRASFAQCAGSVYELLDQRDSSKASTLPQSFFAPVLELMILGEKEMAAA